MSDVSQNVEYIELFKKNSFCKFSKNPSEPLGNSYRRKWFNSEVNCLEMSLKLSNWNDSYILNSVLK